MNFFKIFLTLLFLIFANASISLADNHDQNLSEGAQEIADELQDDEEVPLNDPFAGNEGSSGSLDTSIPEEEQQD